MYHEKRSKIHYGQSFNSHAYAYDNYILQWGSNPRFKIFSMILFDFCINNIKIKSKY